MDVEELQSARSRERRTDSLQPLSESFYTDAGAFVRELRAERKQVADAVDDPFDSSEVRRLTNSIETAENTVEAIYERRVGKVVKLASLEAAGMSTDDDGLTPEERDLFVSLVDAIERNRANVIEHLANEAGSGPDVRDDADDTDSDRLASGTDDSPEPTTHGAGDPTVAKRTGTRGKKEVGSDDADATTATTDAPSTADAMGAPVGTVDGSDRDPDEALISANGAGAGVETASGGDVADDDRQPDSRSPNDTERTTVRITRDVGEIVGVDQRVYDLAAEDVITLPAANAGPLVERDAADRLD